MPRAFLIYVAILVTCVLPVALVWGWRYQDLDLTGQECVWCHTHENLERCHAIPRHARPDLTNVRTNLTILCSRCHLVLSHRGNFKTYNPDLLEILAKYTNSLPNEPDAPVVGRERSERTHQQEVGR